MPPKKDVARALLLRGSVFVHLDPRVTEVVVPQWLRNQPQLVLQIGLDMPIPIPDLRVDDDGVYGTLSFQRSPFTCQVPWEGVFALVGEDGRGRVWPEDLPGEIASEVDREAARRYLRDGEKQLEAIRADTSGKVTHIADAPRDRGNGDGRRERRSTPPGRKRVDLPPYLRVIK